jgi:hypothetical protein
LFSQGTHLFSTNFAYWRSSYIYGYCQHAESNTKQYHRGPFASFSVFQLTVNSSLWNHHKAGNQRLSL